MADLGRIDGRMTSEGTSINNSGVVAGTSVGSGLNSDQSSGGVWKQGLGWTVFSRGSCASGANSVNDGGVVGGYTCHQQGSTDQSRAVLWRPRHDGRGYRQVLLSANDWSSSVSQVADTGDAIGVQTDDNFIAHALYWTPEGNLIHLKPLVGPNAIGWGLTDTAASGGASIFAVGGSDSSTSNENGCFWQLQLNLERQRAISPPSH
jgi:hypothetical protein